MGLFEKKVLVTGGNRGIGFAIAQKFVEKGCNVMISGRNRNSLEEAREKLGKKVSVIEMDVSHINEFQNKLASVYEELGGLDILINNAGIVTESDRKGFFELTEADWDATMNTNLKPLFFLTREAAKIMIEKEIKGSIINICSNTGFYQTTMAYGTSKWGARGLTMGLGHRLARYGIRVNGIAPGPTSTRLMFANDGDKVERSDIPIGRYSYPDEIAELAIFLADDKAQNIVGQVIVADGGEI